MKQALVQALHAELHGDLRLRVGAFGWGFLGALFGSIVRARLGTTSTTLPQASPIRALTFAVGFSA